jgi:hypothetical protein
MQTAHTQDHAHKLVCDIKTAPEPGIVLADDQQLKDLVRFDTTSEFCIDPKFLRDEFDETPLTYRHSLLETKQASNHWSLWGQY